MNPLRLLDGLGTHQPQILREGVRPFRREMWRLKLLVLMYTAGLIVVALVGVFILVAYTPQGL